MQLYKLYKPVKVKVKFNLELMTTQEKVLLALSALVVVVVDNHCAC